MKESNTISDGVGRLRAKTFVASLLRSRFLSPTGRRIAYLLGPCSLFSLYRHAHILTSSPIAALQATVEVANVDAIEAEWHEVRQAQQAAFGALDRNYPSFFEIEDGTAFLLYAFVRTARPEVLVEVGVADGRSTFIILAALDKNDFGQLHSVDIRDDVGLVIRRHQRWKLHIHDPDRNGQLGRLLRDLGPIDFYFHDAGHSYENQTHDYMVGLEALRQNGIFMSDDVDCSYGFLDVCRVFGVRPTILAESRKMVGVFEKF